MDTRFMLLGAAVGSALVVGCGQGEAASPSAAEGLGAADAATPPPSFEYAPAERPAFDRAWLREIGPDEGEPQEVRFDHRGRSIHAFDMPSEQGIEPEVGVKRVGDVLVVWADLYDETRLGVSLRDANTGAALGPVMRVEGQPFVEELGCGGLIHLNELVALVDGTHVTFAMSFGYPGFGYPVSIPEDAAGGPNGMHDATFLVFAHPGARGRWTDVRIRTDPHSPVYTPVDASSR
ncbi:MAG: hypothetical protein ACOCXM_07320 [Myxococcota bacterium]